MAVPWPSRMALRTPRGALGMALQDPVRQLPEDSAQVAYRERAPARGLQMMAATMGVSGRTPVHGRSRDPEACRDHPAVHPRRRARRLGHRPLRALLLHVQGQKHDRPHHRLAGRAVRGARPGRSRDAMPGQAYTVHRTPYTIHHTPYTIHHTPQQRVHPSLPYISPADDSLTNTTVCTSAFTLFIIEIDMRINSRCRVCIAAA